MRIQLPALSLSELVWAVPSFGTGTYPYTVLEREVSGKERKEEAKVGRGISPVSQIVSKTQTDTRKKRRVG